MAIERKDLKFKNPQLLDLSFKMNSNFNKEVYEGFGETNVQIENQVTDNTSEELVFLTIRLGEETEKFPFFMEVKMSSVFSWDDSVEEQTKKSLLDVNAPAILYSYIRPIISNITSASGYPPFILPFMNFTESE